MMNQLMNIFPDQIIIIFISQQAQTRRVAEGAITVLIDSENGLGS